MFAAVSFVLGAGQSVEWLQTTNTAGTAAINLTGNELSQTFMGNLGNNLINGGAGNDFIYATAGFDTLIGGDGTDTVFYGAAQGVAVSLAVTTAQNTHGAGVETLSGIENIYGTTHDDTLVGSSANNILTGGVGDDFLNGGSGVDTLIGAEGNDRYVVNNAKDVVEETGDSGTDTVYASVSYALPNDHNELNLVDVAVLATTSVAGTDAINLTGDQFTRLIYGNAGDNVLRSGGDEDTILGFGGHDTLIGGIYTDRMVADGDDGLAGGGGRDIITLSGTNNKLFFEAVSDSTGYYRDLVQNFDFDTDRLHFTVAPTAIDAAITHGALHTTSFNADLSVAVTADQLAAHHAVLFSPDSGDRAGYTYLIVDANGVAGYQAGQDYLVELQNTHGTLTLADFA